LVGPTETLATYIDEVKFTDFPNVVVQKAKKCLLDSLGCALGGYASEPGATFAKTVEALGGRDSTVIGSGVKGSLANVGSANTYMANILDYDDTCRGHPGCTVNMSALAAGEMSHASGKDVLTAAVVGYEIHSRIAASMYYSAATNARLRGVMHQTYGAVSAAIKILGSGVSQIADALGIAGATAPVQSNAKTSGEENVPPTLKIGFYACSLIGLFSALLAKNGVTGPHNILDGDTGFWRMMGADRCDFDRLVHGLGTDYEILNVAFKPYSCCRWFHSSLDALFEIIGQNAIDAHDIREISVHTTAGKSKVAYLTNPRPANCVGAVFSLPYSIAVALSGIPCGPRWISTETMNDQKILDLAMKVHCNFQEKSEADQVKDIHRWPATVEVTTADKKYSVHVEYPSGSPRNMIEDERLHEKFFSLASPVIGAENSRIVIEMINGLERIPEISELTALLSPGKDVVRPGISPAQVS
jgi:2-methylcitrate dehydratase PrpD